MKNFENYLSAISAALVSIATGKEELCRAWKNAIKGALEQDNIEGLRLASEMLKENAPKYWYTLIEQSDDILYRNIKFVGQISWKKGVASDRAARDAAIITLEKIAFSLADKPAKEKAKSSVKPAYNQALSEKLVSVAEWLEKQKSSRDVALVTVLKAYADASLNDSGASVLEYINQDAAAMEQDKAARYAAAIASASEAQADANKAKEEAASLRRTLAEAEARLAEAEAKLAAVGTVGEQAAAIVAAQEEVTQKTAKRLSRANRSKPQQGELAA